MLKNTQKSNLLTPADTCRKKFEGVGLNMEKLSSLTPEGAPAERRLGLTLTLSQKRIPAHSPFIFLDQQKVLRWELCSQDSFEDVREEETHGSCNFVNICTISIVSLLGYLKGV